MTMLDGTQTDGMWECLLGIRHRGCPISDVSYSFPGVSIQNVSRADIPGGRSRRLLYLMGTPDEIDDFAAECRHHDGVASLERISDDGAGEAYFAAEVKYDESNPSILGVLNSEGVFYHGSVMVQEGIEHWLVYSEEKSSIQALKTELESYENTVNLYRMVDLSELGHIGDVQFGNLLAQLTDKQRITFRTALELGYYDGKSGTTVSDIANELDLHETTTWEHLNKAENAILTDIGSSLFSTIQQKEA